MTLPLPAVSSITLALLLVAAIAVATLGYALVCALSPWGRCRRCNGHGRRRTFGRSGGCHRCDGTGLRLRHGRRLYYRAQRARREATR